VSHTLEEATLPIVAVDLSAAGSIDRRASDESAASSWETLRDRFLGVKLAVRLPQYVCLMSYLGMPSLGAKSSA